LGHPQDGAEGTSVMSHLRRLRHEGRSRAVAQVCHVAPPAGADGHDGGAEEFDFSANNLLPYCKAFADVGMHPTNIMDAVGASYCNGMISMLTYVVPRRETRPNDAGQRVDQGDALSICYGQNGGRNERHWDAPRKARILLTACGGV
jgi:hypothetical protein